MLKVNLIIIVIINFYLSGYSLSKRGADVNQLRKSDVSQDTIKTEGPIEAFDRKKKMVIVESQIGEDTVFYNDQTTFVEPKDSILKNGNGIRIWYLETDKKKVALWIEDIHGDSLHYGIASDNTAVMEKVYEIQGTIRDFNNSTNLIVLTTQTGNDSVYIDKSTIFVNGKKGDLLKRSLKVRIRFLWVKDGKVALSIESL